jgi:hypothetical protein
MRAMLMVMMALLCDNDGAQHDLVPFYEDHKWGFKNEAGKVVIEPKYDHVGAFSCGLAPVNIGYRRRPFTTGKWGYINAIGKVVVPMALKSADEFAEGLAAVSDDELNYRFIDPTGKVVFKLGAKERPGKFSEGVAPVDEQKWSTRYVDRQGKRILRIQGSGREFHEGLAVFELAPLASNPLADTSVGYIDHSGEIAIAPRFARALHFQEGLAAVVVQGDPKKAESWGYIDSSGRFVIEPTFVSAESFRNGIARVYRGGHRIGTRDLTPRSWWRDFAGGEWQVIDRTGRILRSQKDFFEFADEKVPETFDCHDGQPLPD